ncbi:MAG TPA: hypothetical protein VE890_00385, partial [Thermoguttaceae bacterium]|nr:hypothetical protein [Thermoguttaceae bacterium]
MALWPGKKDIEGAPGEPLPEGTDPLEHLTSHLHTLGQMLNQANDQVTAYLLHRESESESATGESDGVLATLAKKIDALADRIETSRSDSTGD